MKHNKYINLHFFGTKEFCDKLNDFFYQELGYKLKMIVRKCTKNNLYGLIAYKQIIAKDIFNLMYKDANIYLERKYKKFIDSLNFQAKHH